MTTIPNARSRPSQAGFTLLEVLIAIVILSIGLLGVAGMITKAMKSNDSAYMRSQATIAANTLLDNMRANGPGVAAGNYSGSTSAVTATSYACYGSTTACSTSSIATDDMLAFKNRLAAIPNGAGAVSVVQTSGTQYVAAVTVTWNDTRAGNAFRVSGNSTQTLTLQSIVR